MHGFTDAQTHFTHMIDIPDLQLHGFIDSKVHKSKDTQMHTEDTQMLTH